MLLVSMPFGPLFWPSIGLSLLKAELRTAGLNAGIRYFTFDFARLIGERLYSRVVGDGTMTLEHRPGDWVFAGALFETGADDAMAYYEAAERHTAGGRVKVGPRRLTPRDRDQLVKARAVVGGFLDRCVDEIAAAAPRIVGLTSVFHQHVPSLALARRLKTPCPDLVVVMGGANCEGVMGAETVRQFPFVDATVSGEADLVIEDLVCRVLSGCSLDGLPGVTTRATVDGTFESGEFPSAPAVVEMDALPYPDYDDYFEQFAATPYARKWEPTLLLETSRGCWWGAKHHCTFCGLNGETLAYRSKSPTRVIDELTDLTRRYAAILEGPREILRDAGCRTTGRAVVQVVDNILDMRYFGTVLPELARRDLGVDLFYEVKANLRKDQMRLLRDAGIRHIQPGIESLSDAVLARMRKGATALQNIQTLKWAQELGLSVDWNILWGFPGEEPSEYARMTRLMPLLSHLEPPAFGTSIQLDRFSPNFDQAAELGFVGVRPLPTLHHIYPIEPSAVANLAYHFGYRHADDRDVDRYARPVARAIRTWKRTHAADLLVATTDGPALVIHDRRPVAHADRYELTGLDRTLYEACDGSRELARLTGIAAATGPSGQDWTTDAVEARLQPWLDAGLMIKDGTRMLSLAVFRGAALRAHLDRTA